MKPPAAVTAASSSQDTDTRVAFCARSVTHPLDALPHLFPTPRNPWVSRGPRVGGSFVSAPWAAIRPRRDGRLH